MLLSKLKTNPNNPRIIKDAKFKKLVKSIKEFPEMLNIRPIVCNKDFIVLGGNMRLKAMIEAGITEAEVKVVDLTPEQEKEFIIKDNIAYGEWEWDVLANEWNVEELKEWGLEVKDVKEPLFSEKIEDEEISGQPKNMRLIDDIYYVSENDFGIPELSNDMIPIIEDKQIATWRVHQQEKDLWFYNWNSDSVKDIQFNKTILGFYVNDERFEGLWNNPSKYVTKIINRNFYAIVEPNFSAHYDDAKAIRIWSIYRSRWLSKYMQESGLKVIPDIKGSNRDYDFNNLGIPIGANCVSIQVHTNWKKEKEIKMDVINNCIDIIKPKHILFYGDSKDRDIIEKEIKFNKTTWIEPRVSIFGGD